ncbi:26S proteasome regulatory complex component [Spraguea lophii 42_110]|uniref:26S proteasome regulatory complex component n=1 Tax=Spraguea lophii (strain 42_110) TaxID=1358809 RepID=S7XFD9_SPRLO|nr:26S proteasome regulatory complex component [Spraguea lophii 42_110]
MPTLETLLEQERKFRLEKDTIRLKDTINAILSKCTNENEFITMLKLLSKRKNQDQAIIKEIIVTLDDNTIDFYDKLLSEVIEGKLWLENERIKISYHLADMHIKNNNITEALNALFKVPIETFAIPIDTMIEFQLEQLRLAVLLKDTNKQNIIEKRITKKLINDELILKYKLLKIDISMQNNQFLEAVEELMELHEKYYNKKNTDLKNNSQEENKIDINFIHKNINILNSKLLINLISFLLILSKDKENKKKDLIEYAIYNKNNTESNRKYLRILISNEIIDKKEIIKILKDKLENNFCYENIDLIDKGAESIDEHNIFIVSKFFISIEIKNFGYLLNLEESELLKKLCYLVNEKKLYCRIDQDKEIIKFKRKEKDWNIRVRNVLEKLVEVDGIIKKNKFN